MVEYFMSLLVVTTLDSPNDKSSPSKETIELSA